MRHALLLVALGLAGTANAQIPLPAFVNTYTANQTRGFWFQAPPAGPPAVVVGLGVPNEAAQPFQVVEFIDLGLVPPPAFPATVTGTQLFYSNSTAGASQISTGIPLIPGNYYGVLGACTSSVGSPTSLNSYAAQGPFVVGSLSLQIGASVGVAFGDGGAGGWRELVERADVRLYQAKAEGRGRFVM